MSCGRKEADTVEAVINSLGIAEPAGATKQRLHLYHPPLTKNSTQAPYHTLQNLLLLITELQTNLPELSSHSSLKMGWLPWSSSDSTKASDGGRIAPDRSSRARCWEGRDAFFACLDRNDILDAIKDDKEARRKCAKEVAEFEAACSQTWVCQAFKSLPRKEVLGLSAFGLQCYCSCGNPTDGCTPGEIFQGEARDGV